MKKLSLSTMLKFAGALVLLGGPLEAADYSAMASQLAAAANAAGFRTLTLEAFEDHGRAGSDKVRYAEEKLTLGLIKEKNLELLDRGRVEGVDCSQKGWFSKAPPEICPQAFIRGSVFKTPEGLSVMAKLIDVSDGRVIAAVEERFEEKAAETAETRDLSLSAVGAPSALPGDLRDAPGDMKAGCAEPLQVLNNINEGAVDLKARYWAAEIKKPGFSYSALRRSPGGEIRDPGTKEKFYTLLNKYYLDPAAPALSEPQLKNLEELMRREEKIISKCGLN